MGPKSRKILAGITIDSTCIIKYLKKVPVFKYYSIGKTLVIQNTRFQNRLS